jgi:hypothetical protein
VQRPNGKSRPVGQGVPEIRGLLAIGPVRTKIAKTAGRSPSGIRACFGDLESIPLMVAQRPSIRAYKDARLPVPIAGRRLWSG